MSTANRILKIVFVLLLVVILGEVGWYFFYYNFFNLKKISSLNNEFTKKNTIYNSNDCFFNKDNRIDDCLSEKEKIDTILFYYNKREGVIISSIRIDRIKTRLVDKITLNDGKTWQLYFQKDSMSRKKRLTIEPSNKEKTKLINIIGKEISIEELHKGDYVELEYETDLLTLTQKNIKIIKLQNGKK